jgi:hypothetical protein
MRAKWFPMKIRNTNTLNSTAGDVGDAAATVLPRAAATASSHAAPIAFSRAASTALSHAATTASSRGADGAGDSPNIVFIIIGKRAESLHLQGVRLLFRLEATGSVGSDGPVRIRVKEAGCLKKPSPQSRQEGQIAVHMMNTKCHCGMDAHSQHGEREGPWG